MQSCVLQRDAVPRLQVCQVCACNRRVFLPPQKAKNKLAAASGTYKAPTHMRPSKLITTLFALVGGLAPTPPTPQRTRRTLWTDEAEVTTRRGVVGGVAAAAATLWLPAYAVDDEYPGTAVERRKAVAARIKEVGVRAFAEPWPETRRNLMYVGGLKDVASTRLAFSDYNHCDLTCMAPSVFEESNADGAVAGISRSNALGETICAGSLQDLGPGGSWATCMIGCASEPPRDVAHVQFKSRIAFKLVWTPGATDSFRRFVLVDDEGVLLASGAPAGDDLPPLAERKKNFALVEGSRYARAATIFRWPDVYDPTFTVEEK